MTLGHASPHRYAALTAGLALAGPGWALEFGVHKGRSLQKIVADRGGEQVVGFDSFQGLPEDWHAQWKRGTFALDAAPTIPGAELVPGWFTDTVRPWADSHPGPVAFIHMDCDLYSSTRDVLAGIGHRLTPGTVLVFDEWHGYPGWQQHEALAWEEFTTTNHVPYTTTLFEHQALIVVGG